MPNKQLRIIIVDSDLSRLIQAEKSLSRLGYFRILPIQYFDDLHALDHELVEPFDVIIANKGFAWSTEDNLKLFWRTTRKINCVLLYEDQKTMLDAESIRSMMARIDPASPWEC
ncbi:hypothetical protein [Pseudomonas fluorescens]|uniref:hypothetical protein n=1 Tax=Pseudomonas fluorescens TaxID=294 RepID=UPI0009379365|nr:hypothetical protein [Pseudomonas fluorescens]